MASQIKKEIAIMKSINHPNVVTIKEVFATSSKIFLVIEYVPGFELADMFRPVSDSWSQKTFGLSPTAAMKDDDLSSKGLRVLRKLGQLIALDMVLNNYDRLPTIWNNKGNPGKFSAK